MKIDENLRTVWYATVLVLGNLEKKIFIRYVLVWECVC